ncbi:hypothetical protein DAPPUDRAFT_315647 [Daphnia pulex]|uniref:Uncharacterized protein n=1 Tax=Daphnia pulex TaxID=6669 RepID=E9GAD1_DAPPU|nr:hypothetical protein DAPPUDRAFT_315647 [Daphnia pulex]|eukprot:EFX83731.1 hypothetical protein DAPPUDRAFT_315647 [Daphnia pulex]
MSEIADPDLNISAIWTSVVLIDCLVRFWLICHTVDNISNAAKQSIFSLRKLRDHPSRDITQTYQHNQVTLAIVEIARTLPKLRLYGLVTLSKELLLQVMETTAAYVLMLNELKT